MDTAEFTNGGFSQKFSHIAGQRPPAYVGTGGTPATPPPPSGQRGVVPVPGHLVRSHEDRAADLVAHPNGIQGQASPNETGPPSGWSVGPGVSFPPSKRKTEIVRSRSFWTMMVLPSRD